MFKSIICKQAYSLIHGVLCLNCMLLPEHRKLEVNTIAARLNMDSTDLRRRAWYESMRHCIQDMTACVVALAHTALPHSSLQARVPHMQAMQLALFTCSLSLSPHPPEELDSGTNKDYALFVVDFTSLLEALVPQLARLGVRLNLTTDSSIGTAEEVVFWELWVFLLSSCVAFGFTPYNGPTPLSEGHQQKPLYISLHSAFQSLLLWLLSMSQSPAWQGMRAEHGRQERNRELLTILIMHVTCLSHVSRQPCQVISRWNYLPPTFLPVLCAVVADQLSTVLPTAVDSSAETQVIFRRSASTYPPGLHSYHSTDKQVVVAFHTFLIEVIKRLAMANQDTAYTGQLSFLTAPAVLQYLKLVVITSPRISPINTDFLELCTVCLSVLLSNSVIDNRARKGASLSSSDAEAHRHIAGLPSHLNPLLSTASLHTDTMLLHALSKHMHKDNSRHIFTCVSIQIFVLQGWRDAGLLCPAPLEALSVMAQSAVGLAKQCMAHGLWLMQVLQKPQSRSLALTCIHRTPEGLQLREARQQVLKSVTDSTDGYKWRDVNLAGLTPDVMRIFKDLMSLTSSFRTHTPDNKPHPRLGEFG